jgi:hypothetical protein
MSRSEEPLYTLLPAVYRQRDFELGSPLHDLLQVIGEQVQIVEDDIGQLYENWFIETCQDWVVPYIGDLIGYQPARDTGDGSADDRGRNRILIPRREVANTIRYRRRKGALSLLEQLARDIAGWPARTVEFHRLIASTQGLDHRRESPAAMIDLRDPVSLALVDTPFDQAAHTVDIRRGGSLRSTGHFNLSNVGLFVWRLQSMSMTRAPAYCLEEAGTHCYTFNVLGIDTQLFSKPDPEADPTTIADELNVPTPIRRGALEVREYGKERGKASDKYYGPSKSLMIWKLRSDAPGDDEPVPIDRIIPADLTGWTYRPNPGDVAVDPVLGRIAFAPGHSPDRGIRVSYHYGFSANMGGGEYRRTVRGGARRRPEPASSTKKGAARPPADSAHVAAAHAHCVPLRYRLGKSDAASSADGGEPDYTSFADALAQWEADAPDDAIIEILDSDIYEEQIEIALQTRRLEIRGASGVRPVLRLVDRRAGRPDAMAVTAEGGELRLDGIVIVGRGLEIKGDLSDLIIRHSTLVPGWSLRHDCEPHRPMEPSITLDNVGPIAGNAYAENATPPSDSPHRPCRVVIEHSIVGSIRVIQDEVTGDPVTIRICDSILDSTKGDLEAVDAPGAQYAHATLSVIRSTVIGRVLTHAIALAEDSIFCDEVRVARRQIGCVRFCYVAPGSRTPRRFNCQPDLAVGDSKGEATAAAELGVRPRFNSTRYGASTYCQLALSCPPEIARGASDLSEMGAFHDLYQSARLDNLRARVEEFVPAGTDAGIIIVT